jgi:hypothetical protein
MAVERLPTTTQYPLDIATIFFQNLSPDTMEALSFEDGMAPEQRPSNESNVQARVRLEKVRDDASRIETRIRLSTRAALNFGRIQGSSNTAGTRSGSAFATSTFFIGADQDAEPWLTVPDEHHDIPGISYGLPPQFASPPMPPEPRGEPAVYMAGLPPGISYITREECSDEFFLAAVHFSAAEESLSRAKREAPVAPECWGCTNHASFHTDRHHLFRQCLNRRDPGVQANFKTALEEYRTQRRAQQSMAGRYGPCAFVIEHRITELELNWQSEGFASAHQAELFCTVVNPATTPAIRASCLTALSQRWERNVRTRTTPPTGQAGSRAVPVLETRPRVQIADSSVNDYFLMLTVPALSSVNIFIFEATLKLLKCPISMSQVLPHTRFPIGLEGSRFQLLALVDSGADLNCGWLACHRSIAERYPDLVLQFSSLADLAGVNPFNIGGVNDAGTSITHVITYRTPYTVNGKEAALTMAGP